MNWEAKGGKSNSQFRKTLDNRFVIKEMSRQENQSFLEFAPHYVQYVIDCVQSKRATAFAKIVGAYRICLMKNTTISSKAVKIDVIVMENLFYTKRCQQVFDLKGSERNRLVNVNAAQSSGGKGGVGGSGGSGSGGGGGGGASISIGAASGRGGGGGGSSDTRDLEKELVLLDENFLRCKKKNEKFFSSNYGLNFPSSKILICFDLNLKLIQISAVFF